MERVQAGEVGFAPSQFPRVWGGRASQEHPCPRARARGEEAVQERMWPWVVGPP